MAREHCPGFRPSLSRRPEPAPKTDVQAVHTPEQNYVRGKVPVPTGSQPVDGESCLKEDPNTVTAEPPLDFAAAILGSHDALLSRGGHLQTVVRAGVCRQRIR